ncbi:helix-turn-helix transcriptional regulator [Paenibacillus macquariensis]|uniref:Predicted DNA-binding transcriptional regulator YafY, contains an HTH and WYL domains n=1 Tax=Paenibacillus macquariensis TaxID=948756 RepID=A0ABY1K7F8_9BACL|nr:YafY family protein [Paenibacillus macquariensis]MEC0091085.1 YafY family protein [Paenibacillus macquariensis]OAB33727.1 DNA-binding transcriptional regulator [Paenibacillus macquariensis subsp. macquariensis]SIR37191.1 Predicted DNA-binding transcriptional regulator YafY, contains an HTH and WYL domains [Paenibacillus macquariensis]
MKRVDRLMAIIMALQQQGETASSLASKMEVSRRTILRDIQSLSEMGVPLYAISGPQGGFRLMEGYHLPPLQLNSQEALTVLFALQGLMEYSDTPFNSERWTVRDKIKNILPKNMIDQIHPLLQTLEMNVPTRNYVTPYLSPLILLTAESKWISTLYKSMNHHRRLILQPHKIYAAHGFWYCEAYSPTHGEIRVFRVDRMEEVKEEQPQEIPQHKSLHDHEHKKEPVSIHIRAKLTYKGMLQVERDEHIGESIRSIGEDEWLVECDLPDSEIPWAIQLFYTLGMDAEVMEPTSLRDGIRSKSSEVYDRYNQ